MGEFVRTVRLLFPTCPKCGAMDKPAPAAPTIEIEKSGRAACNACGHVWIQPKE